MTEDKKYNGWSNYETWNVALYMGNEEGSSRYWDKCAQDCWDAAEEKPGWTREEAAIRDLADLMKSEHEEAMPEVSGMWSDLLSAAFGEVDWYEIAKDYIDEVDKEPEEEEEDLEDTDEQ